MRTFSLLCVSLCVVLGSFASAAERPTLLKTCDPRPDILPRPFYDNHTEYRAQYNRPRKVTGWLAYNMSRTSQEAMVWQENYCAGNYDQHHMPPVYKRYNYPKPWEALNVGARPDFADAQPATARVPSLTATEELEEVNLVAPKEAEVDNGQEVDAQDKVRAAKELVPSPSDK